ncbi:Ala-tRNA(Pro) hydrolase [Notoacmeibacter marinus]|uniref:Alanine--tRNA ligase n=1 Tax=Notoacmeibacter marinus TaxID=1876515 RepID=A0A231UWC4_9HYPH|nr:alanyl-tRNA editing protein [Notoacmeibacter marinus]OXT00243.1 Ala-tRNA(Pro) hydrolase [Notoacmeibacter marinus]
MTAPTDRLFLPDAYLSTVEGKVVGIDGEGGILLDRTNFYATSGGQPGDTGFLERADGSQISITGTVYGDAAKTIVRHLPDEDAPVPVIGETLVLHIDWDRRYRLMRMHTACHLLSVVCPYPITGAAVGENESRVDLDMSEVPDKKSVTLELMQLVEGNHPIFTRTITEDELAANPGLVKSKNVRPPAGAGTIRLVCIGDEASVDSQPCGGTHVSETAEVGAIHIGKIEKKGRENRRFRIRFGALDRG